MVEGTGSGGDSRAVPTVADLLMEYRRLTGASYDEMSRSVNREITTAWFEQLAKDKIKSFPTKPSTVQALADLLRVPVATIVLAYAATLGLPVSQSGSILSISLPPGTDNLDPDDVSAIRAIVAQLVAARERATPTPEPDLATVEGLRLVEEDSTSADARVRNGADD